MNQLLDFCTIFDVAVLKKTAKRQYSAGFLFCCPADGTALLLKRSGIMKNPNVWNIPGGRSEESDRTPLDTALREATEELGTLPNEQNFAKKYVMVRKTKTDPEYEYHVYICLLDLAEKENWTKQINLDEENNKLKWFSINELPTDTHFDLSWIPEVVKTSMNSRQIIYKFATTILPRYEYKYLIPKAQTTDIKNFLKHDIEPDEHGQFYSIKNIYWDNDKLKFFHDHVSQENRFKLRSRFYNKEDNKVSLEIKKKEDGKIIKERLLLAKDGINPALLEDIPFFKVVQENCAKPVMLIDYDREAFNLKNNNGRVTFDTNVKFQKTNSCSKYQDADELLLPEPVCILEFKFDGENMPDEMQNASDHFGLRRVPMSKYFKAMSYSLV